MGRPPGSARTIEVISHLKTVLRIYATVRRNEGRTLFVLKPLPTTVRFVRSALPKVAA